MITLANIRRSVYNLFKRVEGIDDFLSQFVTDWTEFKEEGIVSNQAFPETWHKTGVLNNLIQDINADETATTGKTYNATVSFSDLPENMQQAELKVEIKEDSGKVILFTLINNETAPYYWQGISSYGGEVTWKSFLTEHQDISGKANTADLATVAITGDYNDLINTPSALYGKSAYDVAVDNGFEGTEQEWLASLKGEDGQQGQEGPAGQDGAPGQNGVPGQDGHTPVITASKSNGVTTVSVDGTAIATINDGQDGQNGTSGTNGTNGQDGVTPHIDSTTGNWFIGTTNTGVHAQGPAGQDGQNGTNGTDGNDGTDGITPTITVTSISNGHNVAFSYGTGDNRNTNFNVMDGSVANQLQVDWNQSDNTQPDYIKNKPSIPSIPSNISSFTNDVGYLDGYIDHNNHEYIDLGLPSGTLWAKCNVGAISETATGNYYMWGKGSSQYNSSDSAYSGEDTTLSLSIDSARQVMGGSWQTPTKAQAEELIANTTYEWTTINGVHGAKLTAANGNYIFLPAAGCYEDGTLYFNNSRGYYQSSTKGEEPSSGVYSLSLGTYYVNDDERSYIGVYSSHISLTDGATVRGVLNRFNKVSKVAITGDYNDLINKPTIPTKTSDLTNDAGYLTSHQSLTDYVQKSQTSGLLKNDGTVDTSTYLTSHQSLTDYVQKSQTAGLLKNDGTVDTNTYLTAHQSLSGYAKLWTGTQAQYDLLTPDSDTIYIITAAS